MPGCCSVNALTRHHVVCLAPAPDVACTAGTTRAPLTWRGGTRWSTQVSARKEAKRRSALVICVEPAQGHNLSGHCKLLHRRSCAPQNTTLCRMALALQSICTALDRAAHLSNPRPRLLLFLSLALLALRRDQRDTLGLLAPFTPSLACARPPSLPYPCGGPPHDAYL